MSASSVPVGKVAAGVRDRRNIVFDVSDHRVGDRNWFDLLYRDLESGGTAEFLHSLLRVKLQDWHPREFLASAETTEQQRMSADSITQWSRACVEANGVVGGTVKHDLGKHIASEELREAYTGYCKQQGLRAANQEVFGKACAEMFGPRKRESKASVAPIVATAQDAAQPDADGPGSVDELDRRIACRIAEQDPPTGPTAEPVTRKQRRPWGYDVPDGDTWQEKIDERLGIRK